MSSYTVASVGTNATTTQTSALFGPIDDAAAIGIFMPSTVSTGVLYSIDVCPTATGTVFFPYIAYYSSTPRALVMTSSAGIGSSSVGPFYEISPVTFRQLRISATAVDPTLTSWVVTKQIFT